MSGRIRRKAVKDALSGVDVDLTGRPEEPPPPEPKTTAPFALTTAGSAKLKLREKADGRARRDTFALPSLPGINALSMAIRYLPGGRKAFLEYVKLAVMNGDEHAAAWWAVYADLPKTQRERASFDDVCAGSGVKPSTLLAAVVGHGIEASTDMGNLIAAALHPAVIQAAGKSALRIGGEHAEIALKDRTQLLQARGFLPAPRGTSININAHANANAQAASAASADPSMPRFADDIEELAPVIDVTPSAG